MDLLTLATIGLVIATLVLALSTGALWIEARQARTEAVVVAPAVPWDQGRGQILALYVENAGPAVARDLLLAWSLHRSGGSVTNGAMREAVLGAGFRRTLLPEKRSSMADLATEHAQLTVEWSWRDGRRGRHSDRYEVDLAEVWSGYVGSGVRPTLSETEVLGEIRDAIEKLAK